MASDSKQLILGICGSIACYKSADLVRRLQDVGWQVTVVMTESAQKFVTPLLFESLTQQPVLTALWESRTASIDHIQLLDQKKLILIAPASAHTIAKLAYGLADNLLTTLCLARSLPLLVAPAMNTEMWNQAVVQRNISALDSQPQTTWIEPVWGKQACGAIGQGNMASVGHIVDAVELQVAQKSLQGKRVLISMGATYEAIDPVRGITNLSSGKMGLALVQAVREAGAWVTVVCGLTSVAVDMLSHMELIQVSSAQQMGQAVMTHAAQADVFFSVAAVADFQVAEPSEHKIKRHHLESYALCLKPGMDILKTVVQAYPALFCVGFCAETQDLLSNAQAKCQRKGVDLMVANMAVDSFGQDEAELWVLDGVEVALFERAHKLAQAQRLVRYVAAKCES